MDEEVEVWLEHDDNKAEAEKFIYVKGNAYIGYQPASCEDGYTVYQGGYVVEGVEIMECYIVDGQGVYNKIGEFNENDLTLDQLERLEEKADSVAVNYE